MKWTTEDMEYFTNEKWFSIENFTTLNINWNMNLLLSEQNIVFFFVRIICGYLEISSNYAHEKLELSKWFLKSYRTKSMGWKREQESCNHSWMLLEYWWIHGNKLILIDNNLIYIQIEKVYRNIEELQGLHALVRMIPGGINNKYDVLECIIMLNGFICME